MHVHLFVSFINESARASTCIKQLHNDRRCVIFTFSLFTFIYLYKLLFSQSSLRYRNSFRWSHEALFLSWTLIWLYRGPYATITSRYLDSESFFSGLRWLIWLWFIIIYSQYVVSWNVTKLISLTSPCIYFFCKTWCWLSESLWFPFRSSVEINSFNNGNKSTHSGYQPRRSWKHRHENRVVPTGSLPSLWRFHQGRIRSGFR